MRRLFAIFLMLLLPLQSAWAAALDLHGHLDGDIATAGFHYHDDDGHDHHHDGESAGHGDFLAADQDHQDEGHQQSGHYHPVFSMLVIELRLELGEIPPAGRLECPPAAFVSRIPPLFHRPPATRV